ncbi:hypothetical protein I4U23_022586 [Adineta vaga]|nr:hypothetical protein I4U23_022586 [Adineta vaga]
MSNSSLSLKSLRKIFFFDISIKNYNLDGQCANIPTKDNTLTRTLSITDPKTIILNEMFATNIIGVVQEVLSKIIRNRKLMRNKTEKLVPMIEITSDCDALAHMRCTHAVSPYFSAF